MESGAQCEATVHLDMPALGLDWGDTFQVADAILLIATLSYLGLGVPPPSTNWGDMLSDGVSYTYAGYWWLIFPAGIAIVTTVVAFNLIGDAMRDAFEVRLQKR